MKITIDLSINYHLLILIFHFIFICYEESSSRQSFSYLISHIIFICYVKLLLYLISKNQLLIGLFSLILSRIDFPFSPHPNKENTFFYKCLSFLSLFIISSSITIIQFFNLDIQFLAFRLEVSFLSKLDFVNSVICLSMELFYFKNCIYLGPRNALKTL